MGITTGAKHKIYVADTAPATFDAAGYGAIADWVRTPCSETIPEIVKRLEQVSFNCISSGTTETARGVAAPIPFNPPILDDPDNLGQQLIEAAFNAPNGSVEELLSVKVENEGATQVFYLQVKVTAYGSAERATSTVYLRTVEMVADASTMIEVNT